MRQRQQRMRAAVLAQMRALLDVANSLAVH
jgi:hypothetical protein